jgi:EmrB/QacA subfamily drug resistance transporter
VILCGTFIYVLDFFVVNIALPGITRSLHAGPAAVEWVVAGYGLSSAVLLVLGGRLGDRFGRRAMFMTGLAGFTLMSALCGIAPDSGFLIGARIAQGVAGALMSPNVLAILGTVYTGSARVRAISAFGMVMGVAVVGGQLAGGLLIGANLFGLGWRTVFWVNVPIGIAALLLAPRVVPESRGAGGTRLDVAGAGLLTVALTAVLLPLLDGREEGWPAWSLACLAAGLVLLAVFVGYLRRSARRGGQPLLDPGIFAIRAFRAGLTCQILFWCQQAAGYLLLALYLQQGRGLPPIEAGGVFSVLAAGYLITSVRAPALTVRFGRRVVATGAVLGALGDVLLALAVGHGVPGGQGVPGVHSVPGGPVWMLFPGLLILGAGQGLCLTPLTTTVLAHADARTAGSVSGALSTAQQAGNAIGVAVSGIIFYGLLARGYAVAYRWSVLEMGALLLVVVALTFLIPSARASSPSAERAG